MTSAFRARTPKPTVRDDLGLLGGLVGHWVGHGFTLVARPDHSGEPPFVLELNSTRETLDVAAIGGSIPNRGSLQGDIGLHGLHYLHQVLDVETGTGLHIEPGVWLRVPPTRDPSVGCDTYVRQSTIPHGGSLLAQSTFATTVSAAPTIHPVHSTPFTGAVPELNAPPAAPIVDPGYLAQYRTDVLPAGLPVGLDPVATIRDPTLLLNRVIDDLPITSTAVITISTDPVGGIISTPFVSLNANPVRMDAIFWIERVEHPGVGAFLQIQYVQRVILDFLGVLWPHLSVATLRTLQ